MISIIARVPPTEADCDKLGQVMIWNHTMGYWSTCRLDRALILLSEDPSITHWQRMPDQPICYK